jgi:hypothetical protein
MNRRGRRLAFMVAGMSLVVFLGLGVLYWGTVRDHVQAWHFQFTRETKLIEPLPGLQGMPLRFVGDTPARSYERLPVLLQRVANCTARPVIFALEDDSPAVRVKGESQQVTTWSTSLDVYGLRIVEQCFPRRAYVVVRDKDPPAWWDAPME